MFSPLLNKFSRAVFPVITPVRCLSRMRTKTPKQVYWFRRLVPPVFDQDLARERIEAEPEVQFKEIAPALINQNSSIFYNPIEDKFFKMVMVRGKRELADEIMRRTYEIMKREQLEKYRNADEAQKEKIELNPTRMLLTAINNCKPVLCLTGIRRGGIVYQVPAAVRDEKSEWTAMKWLILASRDNPKFERSEIALAREISSAFHNQGKVVKRKHDLHKQCEANKAYAHYRWAR
ncbi:28S ribosomal protein S7, mitochondrial-like [Paramacrobiotus metropolitanus]|uniref:28S ribosomal protein S7, mitochondrial-like n=1 Tax=Paramacrobiotus metropolitanus TaxID=2943436 RepID=UPI002445F80B|nr:28S ribosomal protein S7, mitochondrial-like [Paramacrobiotus metropolitanus]